MIVCVRVVFVGPTHERTAEVHLTVNVVGVPSPFMADTTNLALEDDIDSGADERASDVFDRAREVAAEQDSEIQTEVEIGQSSRKIV